MTSGMVKESTCGQMGQNSLDFFTLTNGKDTEHLPTLMGTFSR